MALGWIAHVAFWTLLGVGVVYGDLAKPAAAIVLAFWLIGFLALNAMSYGAFFLSYVAVLDIFLVFVVLKGDARLN